MTQVQGRTSSSSLGVSLPGAASSKTQLFQHCQLPQTMQTREHFLKALVFTSLAVKDGDQTCNWAMLTLILQPHPFDSPFTFLEHIPRMTGTETARSDTEARAYDTPTLGVTQALDSLRIHMPAYLLTHSGVLVTEPLGVQSIFIHQQLAQRLFFNVRRFRI